MFPPLLCCGSAVLYESSMFIDTVITSASEAYSYEASGQADVDAPHDTEDGVRALLGQPTRAQDRAALGDLLISIVFHVGSNYMEASPVDPA